MSLFGVVAVMTISLIIAAPADGGAATSHARRHMPRLIGLTRSQVYAIMKADQLYFQTRGPGSSNATWVTVTAQSPAPGVMVAWHSQAILTTETRLSRGPRAMPRLLGLDRAQVYAAMRRAQLFFTTSGPGSATSKWIVVLRQVPAAGTRVRWHSQATLVVSTRRPVVKHPAPERKKTTTTSVRTPTTTTTRRPPATTSTTTTTTTVVGSTTTTYPGETTTTTIPSATTTTTVKKVTPTTTTTQKKVVKKRIARYRIGDATWYSYIPGRCATWYLPMGTRVTVRNLVTGRAVTCVVTDREAARGNRVVDLSETEFARLQPLWRGVVRVKVSW